MRLSPAAPAPATAPSAPFAAEAAAPPREAVKARVAGRLVTEDSRPFEGNALVRVLRDDGRAEYSAEASGGTFSVGVPPDLPAFRLAVEADFARYRKEEWFALGTPEVEEGLTLVLEPAGSVEATLRGPDGSVPETGRLSLLVVSPQFGWRSRALPARGGKARLRGLLAGKYAAVADATGFGPSSPKEVEVRDRETSRLDLVLSEDSFLAGRVVDSHGAGVAGAGVTAHPSGGFLDPASALGPFATTTDGAGAFRLRGLRGGAWTLQASKPGMLNKDRDDRTVQVPTRGGVEGIVFTLDVGRSIAGRVVDRRGSPVRGAKVVTEDDLTSEKRRWRTGSWRALSGSSVTDERGAFRISGLDEGPFAVEARREGNGVARISDVGPDAEGLELVLPGPTGVAGVVREEGTAAAVRAFRVHFDSVRRNGLMRSGGVLPLTFVTQDGAFELLDLMEGSYDLRVEAQGFGPQRVAAVEVKAGEIRRDLEVLLRRAATVRGTVVERETGLPVPGARVSVLDVDGNDGLGRTTAADAAGRFEAKGLKPGPHRLLARLEGFVDSPHVPVEVAEGGTVEGIVIEVSRGGAVEGRAVGTNGLPFARGWATANPVDSGGDSEKHSNIGPDGFFRIEGLAPGKWSILASRPRIEQGSIQVVVAPGEESVKEGVDFLGAVVLVEDRKTTRVDFEKAARPQSRVRVRVRRGEEAVAGAFLKLWDGLGGQVSELWSLLGNGLQGETGEEGVFVFEGVPPGPARLFVSGGESSAESERKVEVPGSGEVSVEISLPGGEIGGLVFKAEDRSPIEKMFVQVEPEGKLAADAWAGSRARFETDAEGRFRVRDLPPGSYWVIAGQLPGNSRFPKPPADDYFAAPVGPVEVAEASAVTVEIAAVAGGRAAVRVVDSAGKPLEGAEVRVRPLEAKGPGQFLWGPGGTTDARGIARIAGITPGRHFASARVAGYPECASAERVVKSGEEAAFEIAMLRGTRVRISFVAEGGRALAPGTPPVRDAKGREVLAWPPKPGEGPPEEQGKAIVHLVPGDYTVGVWANGGFARWVAFRVGDASPQEVVVRLEPGELRR